MPRTSTVEFSQELEARLMERGIAADGIEAVVAELLEEVEYLERVNERATGGYWPAGEYY